MDYTYILQINSIKKFASYLQTSHPLFTHIVYSPISKNTDIKMSRKLNTAEKTLLDNIVISYTNPLEDIVFNNVASLVSSEVVTDIQNWRLVCSWKESSDVLYDILIKSRMDPSATDILFPSDEFKYQLRLFNTSDRRILIETECTNTLNAISNLKPIDKIQEYSNLELYAKKGVKGEAIIISEVVARYL